MRLLRRFTYAVVLAFVLVQPATAQDGTSQLQSWNVDDTYIVAIATFGDDLDWSQTEVLMVIAGGELIWSMSQFSLSLHDNISVGTDVTGDGKPNLIVREYNGGGSCCIVWHVLSLEPDVRKITHQQLAENTEFLNLDGCPGLEIRTFDDSFMFWQGTNRGQSAYSQVVLAWDGDSYIPAPGLMVTSPPPAAALSLRATTIAASDQWSDTDMDPDLWREMLDLIYSGHADLAWTFLDDGWPTDRAGKDTFKTNFRCQLAQSPYWDAIAAMNGIDSGDVPADCSGNTGG